MRLSDHDSPAAAPPGTAPPLDDTRLMTLKELLTEYVDSEDACFVISDWTEGIIRSTVSALPTNEDFLYTRRGENGKRNTVRLKDEVCFMTPLMQQWLDLKTAQARHHQAALSAKREQQSEPEPQRGYTVTERYAQHPPVGADLNQVIKCNKELTR